MSAFTFRPEGRTEGQCAAGGTGGGGGGGCGGIGAFYYCTLSKEAKPEHADERTKPSLKQAGAEARLLHFRGTNLPPPLCFPIQPRGAV